MSTTRTSWDYSNASPSDPFVVVGCGRVIFEVLGDPDGATLGLYRSNADTDAYELADASLSLTAVGGVGFYLTPGTYRYQKSGGTDPQGTVRIVPVGEDGNFLNFFDAT